jgi:hypothetical protein
MSHIDDHRYPESLAPKTELGRRYLHESPFANPFDSIRSIRNNTEEAAGCEVDC